MKENARQGFSNGSLPPIGYRIVEAVERHGHRTKKTLKIDPIQAETVRLTQNPNCRLPSDLERNCHDDVQSQLHRNRLPCPYQRNARQSGKSCDIYELRRFQCRNLRRHLYSRTIRQRHSRTDDFESRQLRWP
jgi:hypothetical protein